MEIFHACPEPMHLGCPEKDMFQKQQKQQRFVRNTRSLSMIWSDRCKQPYLAEFFPRRAMKSENNDCVVWTIMDN